VTGNTPLMYAAMENKTLIIERMIEHGCDIHAKNKVTSLPAHNPNKF
jgi:ankyrin repeat protein